MESHRTSYKHITKIIETKRKTKGKIAPKHSRELETPKTFLKQYEQHVFKNPYKSDDPSPSGRGSEESVNASSVVEYLTVVPLILLLSKSAALKQSQAF